MSLLDYTYYNSDINLTSEQIEVLLDSWQSNYEEIILKKLLGYNLYALYKTDLTVEDDKVDEPTAQRFKDLVDGKVFTFEYNGTTLTREWKGLRDKTLLKSLIAYYVYYIYRNETESYNSGAGQVSALTENSTKSDVRPKLISTWNKMVDLYGNTPDIYCYRDLFTNNESYVHFNSYPSAYNFLLANLETYPEWEFEPLEKQNLFGI